MTNPTEGNIMTKAIITAYHCLNCDDAIYARVESDERECTCGNLHMQGDSILIRDFPAYRREEDLTVRQSEEILAADFESCKDNFGILRYASKTIPRLREDVKTEITARTKMTDTDFDVEVA